MRPIELELRQKEVAGCRRGCKLPKKARPGGGCQVGAADARAARAARRKLGIAGVTEEPRLRVVPVAAVLGGVRTAAEAPRKRQFGVSLARRCVGRDLEGGLKEARSSKLSW